VIGNIFIGCCRKEHSYVDPVIDELSDDDAKLLIIKEHRLDVKLS
jgi:hypothetical protein